MKTTEIWNVSPEEKPVAGDPSLHLTQIALAGYTQLAADTLLRKENQGKVRSIIENSIDHLDKAFRENRSTTRKRCVEVLLEVALNFLGMERKRTGFSDEETAAIVDKITATLQNWERADSGVSVRAVVDQMLRAMKLVLSGKGMVAKMAEEIEGALVTEDLANSFIAASKQALQNNVYYRIVDGGLSKFGNDSATGLRWARHLGAVQVSSNPVIAARAYDEIADLWDRFEIVASAHPEWRRDPERYADEIALYGTVVSLLPNILDFRPIALLSDFKDGMVSIQLNPRKASNAEESVKDALKFYSILQEILESYDAYLTAGANAMLKGRPNIVFKVSTCAVEAIALTESLDGMGIGTNNTVTFTVPQEIKVSLVAMKGLAAALKAGTPITTIYITNMEGRLEDHLRESQGANLLRTALEENADKDAKIRSLAQATGALDDLKKAGSSVEQQLNLLCSKKYLKSLADGWFIQAVGIDKAPLLKQTEEDIRMSGIYITRKVFQLLFQPALKSKLVKYLEEEFDLSETEATQVVEAVNLLPASKRRAEDTYLVLGDRDVSNLTNTEFPDHQLKVLQRSRESGFRLSDFENSIAAEPDRATLERLLQIPDFVKGYELNSGLVRELSKIGIAVSMESGGLEPEEWFSYGPARKTMDEFNNAYLSFRSRLLSSLAKPSMIDRQQEITTQTKAR